MFSVSVHVNRGAESVTSVRVVSRVRTGSTVTMADSRPPSGVSSLNTPGSSQPALGSTLAGPATAEAVPGSIPFMTIIKNEGVRMDGRKDDRPHYLFERNE